MRRDAPLSFDACLERWRTCPLALCSGLTDLTGSG
jgi:hypothetical protein